MIGPTGSSLWHVVGSTVNAFGIWLDIGAVSRFQIATLVETFKMNGVESYAWPRNTLERIAASHPMSSIHDLLPKSFGARAGNR